MSSPPRLGWDAFSLCRVPGAVAFPARALQDPPLLRLRPAFSLLQARSCARTALGAGSTPCFSPLAPSIAFPYGCQTSTFSRNASLIPSLVCLEPLIPSHLERTKSKCFPLPVWALISYFAQNKLLSARLVSTHRGYTLPPSFSLAVFLLATCMACSQTRDRTCATAVTRPGP